MTTCNICGASPCANPSLCAKCRAADGSYADDEPPPPHPDDYGSARDRPREQAERQGNGRADNSERGEPEVEIGFPLRVGDWLKRTDLVEPDFLLGHIFSTTTRALMWAPTGLGKTLLGLSLAWTMAAGGKILGWKAKRKARVLYIDGEMSRRLLLERLKAECERAGVNPDDLELFVFSHEDIPNFMPLNTPAGQKQIEAIIKRIGGVDFIIFDNIMSLTVGDMREGKSWSDTLPWVKSLTKRLIGQLWIHHTGHDETKSYGDKSKEWQLDLVIGLTKIERVDTDVSFTLTIDKARERTPATRADFADATVALVNDQWTSKSAVGRAKDKVSPLAKKFYAALVNATTSNDTTKMFNCPTATTDEWRGECLKVGLLDKDKPKSAITIFNRHKRDLIAANWIACNETAAWTLPN
jgi:hypothetical protein